uniref:Uncharacterized protein n=1 Tax=Sphaerodactylus townsendi TaxID=933632 RepID=A0ACB8EM00_9SAUR
MRIIELQEKMIVSEDWIEEAEKKLLKHFHAIQKNIQRLIKMCAPLLQMTEKARRKSAARVSLFQAWRVKVIENPQLAEPLKAEQMVEDEALTFAYTREINEMILELTDLLFFNKEEVTAIKYIAAMVENLTKAFGLLSRQFRSLKVKLEVGAAESRKHDPQVTSLQRELRMIIEKKAALELQVQHAEERCKLLLTTNEAMQKELQSAYERGQMSKPSLSSPSSKVLQEKTKSQVDIQKDVSVTKSVKQFQPTASKVSSVESEAPSSSEEMRKLKHESEDYDTQKQVSVVFTTQSQTSLAQDSQSKKSLKETTSQIASQKLAEKTTPPGEKKRWEFPIEKVIQSIKTLKTDKQPTSPLDPKLATAKVVTESNLSQSSGAGVPGNIQELTSEGESSPQSSTVSSPTSRITEDVKLSAEKPLPKSPGIQLDGKSERKLSLKHSAQKIVKDVKSQKRVKFLKGVSAQTALDSSELVGTEIPEGSPLQESLTGTAEDVEPESQDAQTGRFKEKKEMDPRSILVKRPTDISEREGEKEKQAKIMRDVIHHLGIKLQELAKEKGGVLEEDTIKELFDEVDMTPEEDISEQDISGHGRGSLTADMLARAPLVRRFELHTSAIERSSKSREDPGEAVSKQDVKSALQEFQASILACIEDKLEKLKKPSSDSLKEPEKPKPADPQVQDLYQEIDRKLDECFSAMKHKHRGAMIKRKSSSQRSGEKEIKLQSSLESPTIMSQESSVSSLSLPEEEGDQQTVSKAHKLSKQHLKQAQTVLTDQEKQQRKKEDLSKYIHPEEEKLLHLPEVVLCVQEKKSQEKELQQTESLLESEPGLWLLRLQGRLEWEKERLHEEQLRLQEERQRLQDEEQYLQHWHNLFENQQEQWSQQQQQQQDQECLWNGQLEHWQQVTQDHEEIQQHWWLNEEQHQQQLQQLQEELQTLQRQYEQQLLQQKEQTEDQRHWDELQVWREKQLQTWQEEDTEQEKKRRQWRQQLADHEKFLETWQQEKAEREAQYNNWQEEMWQQQQAQESLWQRQSQQQQRRWQRQVQRHHIQERKRQAQQQKVQERQKQIWSEEEILAPKLKMLRTRVQGELAKEVQQQELREPLSIKLEPPTHKIQVPPTARMDYLLPATHKAGPLPTTPDLSPEPSDVYIDSFDLDITFSPKLFPRDDGFPAPSMTEQHYSLSVETQRKNLELLEEANQKVGLTSDLYKKAKETITEVLNSNVERLALLFRKYIAFRRLQEIRQILTAQLDAAKDDKDGATVQKLYRVVERLDAHQEKVLNNWRTDQKTVEKKRQHNMENMIVLFAQVWTMIEVRQITILSLCHYSSFARSINSSSAPPALQGSKQQESQQQESQQQESQRRSTPYLPLDLFS